MFLQQTPAVLRRYPREFVRQACQHAPGELFDRFVSRKFLQPSVQQRQ